MNIVQLFPFWKTAEKKTMEKILSLGRNLLVVDGHIENILSLHTREKLHVHTYREYLLQKAEHSRICLEIDETIRNHEVECPCGCRNFYKLKQLTVFSQEKDDIKFVINCGWRGELIPIPFGPQAQKSFKRLLAYAHVPYEQIFESSKKKIENW